MRRVNRSPLFLLFALLFCLTALAVPRDARADFTRDELEQMLAPVALYPDTLLSQLLMAATYPLEVIEAGRWLQQNPGLSGEEAVNAAANSGWDPSVISLTAFPQLLQSMSQSIEWTQQLGDAFLDQQAEVMDVIQLLRQRAMAAGNLYSSPQMQVMQVDGEIEIAPPSPELVYVPEYNPWLVYGSWWSGLPPAYWPAWQGYAWSGAWAWGRPVPLRPGFFFGSWNWRRHQVWIWRPGQAGNLRVWQHNPWHRRGVPYRDVQLYHRYGAARPPRPTAGWQTTTAGPLRAGPALPPGVSVVHLNNLPYVSTLPDRISPQTRPAAAPHQVFRPEQPVRAFAPTAPSVPRWPAPPAVRPVPQLPSRFSWPARSNYSVFEHYGRAAPAREENARGRSGGHAGGSFHGGGH